MEGHNERENEAKREEQEVASAMEKGKTRSQYFKSEVDMEDAVKAGIKNMVKDEDTDGSLSSRGSEFAAKPEPDSEVELETKPASNSKSRSPKKRKSGTPKARLLVKPPETWSRVYDFLREMRTPGAVASNAAVDTMGCASAALDTSSPRDQRFHTLIALMLSSQTKDTTTFAAMRHLQLNLPSAGPDSPVGLNLENILAVHPTLLNEMIHSVGFHNNKTKHIKATALILRDEHGGDIPDTAERLMSLPGVGPKMAYLCLSSAWGKVLGIGVDTHVHRFANMWHWAGAKETSTPEQTRMALESWLPRDRWAEVNHLLVGFGQTVCPPQRGQRKCGECLVGLEGLCRVADRAKVNAGRKARDVGLKIEYEEVKLKVKDGGKLKTEVVEDMKVVEEEAGEEKVIDIVPAIEEREDGDS